MARNPGRILSLGSVLVDVGVDVPELPHKGGDVLATGTRIQPGAGFNLAAAAARQGAQVLYCGPHGAGPYGDLTREALTLEGIGLVQTVSLGRDTGFCIVLVEPDAERTFVTMTGAEAILEISQLQRILPGPSDIIAVSGYDLTYPRSGAVLADWLQTAGKTCSVGFDPGPLLAAIPGAILNRVLAVSDVVTLNQREARTAVGDDFLTGTALLASLRTTLPIHRNTLLVIREGAAGCTASGGSIGSGTVHIAAHRVDAIDTTGAGDTHTGVLLARLLENQPVTMALAAANVAAAISVTQEGSATAPTRVVTDSYLHEPREKADPGPVTRSADDG